MQVKVGDKVLCSKYAGTDFKVDGKEFTIIKQSDRLANLIRSIINFSAIDSDELPDYEVDISELIASAFWMACQCQSSRWGICTMGCIN